MILDTQDPLKQRVLESLQALRDALVRTDELGRDLYARIVYGARTATLIGVLVVLISQSLAMLIGVVSGYYGGWRDSILQRFVTWACRCVLVTIILVVQTLVGRVPGCSRSFSGRRAPLRERVSDRARVTLSIAAEQYVEAARALGATDARINVPSHRPERVPDHDRERIDPGRFGRVIESSLSFLGYGVQPPTPSWGRMLSDARENLVNAPHIAFSRASSSS